MRTAYRLAALARRAGARRNFRLRALHPPPALERAALKIVMTGIRALAIELRNTILPAYEAALKQKVRDDATVIALRDDATDWLKAALRVSAGRVARLSVSIDFGLGAWAVKVEEWQRGAFAAGIKTATSLDVGHLLSRDDFRGEIKAAVERNAALIRGLDDDARKRVEETIWREYLNETPRGDIAALLQEQLEISGSRADLIARDQTTKIANKLNELRQRQAGISKFVWRHSGKVNAREEHEERDGEIYSWDDPPEDLPGDLPNCGCTAESYVEVEEEDDDLDDAA